MKDQAHSQERPKESKPRQKTSSFILELPLRVGWSQERQLRAHLEVARSLYNALLAEGKKRLQQTIPSITQTDWAGAEPRLRAVMEDLQQRANEGQVLPRSMGLSAPHKGAARAGARRLESPAYPQLEPVFPQ